MKCLACNAEYREGVTHCADCGCKLVPDEVVQMAKAELRSRWIARKLAEDGIAEVVCPECGAKAHIPISARQGIACFECGEGLLLPPTESSLATPPVAAAWTVWTELPDLGLGDGRRYQIPAWLYFALAPFSLLRAIFRGTWRAAIVVGIVASVLSWTGLSTLRWVAGALLIGWVAGGISYWIILLVVTVAKRPIGIEQDDPDEIHKH